MNTKIISLFVVLSIFIFSCKEENETNKDNNLGFLSFLNTNDYSDAVGTITFSSKREHQNEHGDFYYEARAQVFTNKNKDTLTYAGNIKIGNFNLVFNTTDTNYNFGLQTNSPDLRDLFGSTTEAIISGSPSVESSTISFYCPKRMELSLNNLTELSKSQDLEVSWNADANNPHPVSIAIVYDGTYSNITDSSFSDVSQFIYSTTTDDDGNFTIPNSSYANLTTGKKVFVIIGRGNAILSGATNDKLILQTYTYDRQPLEISN